MNKNKTLDLIEIGETLQKFTETLENLDMSKLEDLEKAYETISEIEVVINNAWEKYPFLKTSFELFTAMLGVDISTDVSEWKENIAKIIKEKKAEQQKENGCKCTPHNCGAAICFCDDDCWDDDEYEECTPEYVEEILEYCLDNFEDTKKYHKNYFKLISDYINKECPYLNLVDDEVMQERDDMIWSLFDFINYTMRR